MQVATGMRRPVTVLIAVSLAVLSVLVVTLTASAQESAAHRFFGFSGDVTIDGEPLLPGDEIFGFKDGVEIGRSTVNSAGAWILDVDGSLLDAGPCEVTFVVRGLSTHQSWDTCPLRVRLALVRPSGSADSGTQTANGSAGGAADNGSSTSSEGASDALEGDETDSLAGDDEQGAQSLQEREIVRPAAPRTGTGGALGVGEDTNWPRAAAVTALLTFAFAVVALLIARRTDGAA